MESGNSLYQFQPESLGVAPACVPERPQRTHLEYLMRVQDCFKYRSRHRTPAGLSRLQISSRTDADSVTTVGEQKGAETCNRTPSQPPTIAPRCAPQPVGTRNTRISHSIAPTSVTSAAHAVVPSGSPPTWDPLGLRRINSAARE